MSVSDLQRVQWKDKEVLTLQKNIYEFVNQFKNTELLTGVAFKNLAVNTTLTITHGLNREPLGFIVTNKNANANIWATLMDKNFIYLISSASVEIDIWVY